MIPASRKPKPAALIGVTVTLCVVGAIEALTRFGVLAIATPAALTLVAVVFAGYIGGLRAGLASAALAVLFGLYHFSAPGEFLQYSGDDATRMLVLAIAAPFVAWMSGALRDRGERALLGQIASERVRTLALENAERRIRVKEAQLRNLIDALPAYVAYVDRDLRVRFHNKAYEKWTGLPASFIDGHTVAEVIGEELFDSGTKGHALAALEGQRSVFERVQTDFQGTKRTVEAHFIPDMAEDGTVAGYFGMLFDVSRRKQAQSDAARLGERLRRALAGSRLVLWEMDLRTGIVMLGREWAAIVGGKEEVTEVPLAELRKRVHPDDLERLDAAFRSMIERRAEQYDIEHRVQALDGEWKWVRSTGRAVEFDADGRPIRLSGTNRDITARKRAELAVQESERKLRLITDAVPAMIVYVDADMRYRFCNQRYCELMGRSEQEVLGRTVREVVGEEQYEVSRPWLENTLAGERGEHERRYRRLDGREVNLSVTYMPHVEEGGKVLGLYALLVDLTERHRAERIKERFISMVSHELRTPLSSIIWTLEALTESAAGGLSGEQAHMVGLAQQNAERMLHLADEILDLEKIDQGELRMSPRIATLRELVEKAIALSQTLAGKRGVELSATHLPGAAVMADPGRLVQVLVNLISNAVKHSPHDGRIDVAVRLRGAMLRVSVADRGRGVPENFRDQLFARFAQSSAGRELGGTGLGLAICKEIVGRSGGTIGYEPNPEGGSVFWFELPAMLAASEPGSRESP